MLGCAFVSPFSLTVHLVLNKYWLKKEKEKDYEKKSTPKEKSFKKNVVDFLKIIQSISVEVENRCLDVKSKRPFQRHCQWGGHVEPNHSQQMQSIVMEGVRIDFVFKKLLELEKRKYDSIVARGKLWFQVS